MGFFSMLLGKQNNSELVTAINEGAFLVDVRTTNEFSGGSVKGAVNIPLDRIPTQLSKFTGKKNIVVFCMSGGRSGQAKSILQHHGFQNIINGGSLENVKQILVR